MDEIRDLNNKVEERDGENSKLSESLAEISRELEVAQAQIVKLSKEKEESDKQLHSKAQNAATLSQNLLTEQRNHAAARLELAQTKQISRQQQDEIERLESDVIEELSERLEDKEEAYQALDAQKNVLRAKIEKLEEETFGLELEMEREREQRKRAESRLEERLAVSRQNEIKFQKQVYGLKFHSEQLRVHLEEAIREDIPVDSSLLEEIKKFVIHAPKGKTSDSFRWDVASVDAGLFEVAPGWSFEQLATGFKNYLPFPGPMAAVFLELLVRSIGTGSRVGFRIISSALLDTWKKQGHKPSIRESLLTIRAIEIEVRGCDRMNFRWPEKITILEVWKTHLPNDAEDCPLLQAYIAWVDKISVNPIVSECSLLDILNELESPTHTAFSEIVLPSRLEQGYRPRRLFLGPGTNLLVDENTGMVYAYTGFEIEYQFDGERAVLKFTTLRRTLSGLSIPEPFRVSGSVSTTNLVFEIQRHQHKASRVGRQAYV